MYIICILYLNDAHYVNDRIFNSCDTIRPWTIRVDAHSSRHHSFSRCRLLSGNKSTIDLQTAVSILHETLCTITPFLTGTRYHHCTVRDYVISYVATLADKSKRAQRNVHNSSAKLKMKNSNLEISDINEDLWISVRVTINTCLWFLKGCCNWIILSIQTWQFQIKMILR